MELLDRKLTYASDYPSLGKIIPIRKGKTLLITETKTLREIVELEPYIEGILMPDFIQFDFYDASAFSIDIYLNNNTYVVNTFPYKIRRNNDLTEKLSKIILSGFLTIRRREDYLSYTHLPWETLAYYVYEKLVYYYTGRPNIPEPLEVKEEYERNLYLIKDIVNAPSIFDTINKNSPLPEEINKMIFEEFIGGDDIVKFDMLTDCVPHLSRKKIKNNFQEVRYVDGPHIL